MDKVIMLRLCLILGLGVLTGSTLGQEISTSNAPGAITTTPSAAVDCGQYNTSCDSCVGAPGAKCLWCPTAAISCITYPAGSVFPNAVCNLTDARWLNCWVNFQVLLIMIGVLGCVILIALLTCFYCCCCKTSSSSLRRRERRDDEQAQRHRAERQAKSDARKADRESRYDEIRRKYGLSNGKQYAKFDNDAES